MRHLSLILATAALCLTSCDDSPDSTKSATRTCPDWSSSPQHNYSNSDFSNFGCAYYNNIAVQVENPDDLQKGHGVLVGDGDRESVNTQKYQTATQQQAPTVSTSQSR